MGFAGTTSGREGKRLIGLSPEKEPRMHLHTKALSPFTTEMTDNSLGERSQVQDARVYRRRLVLSDKPVDASSLP